MKTLFLKVLAATMIFSLIILSACSNNKNTDSDAMRKDSTKTYPEINADTTWKNNRDTVIK